MCFHWILVTPLHSFLHLTNARCWALCWTLRYEGECNRYSLVLLELIAWGAEPLVRGIRKCKGPVAGGAS